MSADLVDVGSLIDLVLGQLPAARPADGGTHLSGQRTDK
jgi:hypothetical protein